MVEECSDWRLPDASGGTVQRMPEGPRRLLEGLAFVFKALVEDDDKTSPKLFILVVH